MNTNSGLLDVQLPATLIESPSVSTFLPEEDASICPLLQSNRNGSTTPMMTFAHPLTPLNAADNDCQSNNNAALSAAVLGGGAGSRNDDDERGKGDNSSSGSSSGIGGLEMVADSAATSLFNKHSAYQHLHLQNNNLPVQDGNGHMPNGSNSRDAPPSFVSWNWPLIRKCTFFAFMSSLLAMCAVVVAMIVTLPKSCNPKVAWYHGSVFYEVFPASFEDSNNDGVGDLRGIGNRIDYLVNLGVSAVRLNSIYPSPHYPEDFEAASALSEVAAVLGTKRDVAQLAESLHARNISLLLDLSVQGFWSELLDAAAEDAPVDSSLEAGEHQWNGTQATTPPPITAALASKTLLHDNLISAAVRQWLALGVDGFYIKGLAQVPASEGISLAAHLAAWKRILGAQRVLIVSEADLLALPLAEQRAALPHIDLVDVSLDLRHGTKRMEERLRAVLSGPLAPNDNDGVWLHWSIGGVDRPRLSAQHSANFTLAATLMQLMLPGTPSIFYGDEIALSGEPVADAPADEQNDTRHLQQLTAMQWPTAEGASGGASQLSLPWLPQRTACAFEQRAAVAAMIRLRQIHPALYKNTVCKLELNQPNTDIRRSHDDILIVDRNYPRRNSFVAVSNYGEKRVSMDMSSMFYSGSEMLHAPPDAAEQSSATGSAANAAERIYFTRFEIGPVQTIVVKLDK